MQAGRRCCGLRRAAALLSAVMGEPVLLCPQLDQLIQAIYRGPLEDKPWQRFLELYSEALGADQAVLMLRPPTLGDLGVILNTPAIEPFFSHAYNNTYYALDPFVNLPPGQVMTSEELIPLEMLRRGDFYTMILKPLGIGHIIAADLKQAEQLNVQLRASRKDGKCAFGAKDKALTQALLPHLEIAINLHMHMTHAEVEMAVYADAVDHLAMGCIILDEDGRVLRTNGAADHLLQKQRHLRITEGRLQVATRAENIAFRGAIEEVLTAHRESRQGFLRTFHIHRPGVWLPLGLLLRPLPRGATTESRESPAIALFISDPHAVRQSSTEVIQELFGFTPAEAQLSLLLAGGRNLDEAALELGVTRNTAKSHLRAVFAKAGISRQSQLVQLMLGSVAGLA